MRIPPHSPTSSALCGAVIARPGHIGKRSLTWRQRVTWAEAVAQWRGEVVLAAWATKSRGERHHASKLTAARALAIKTAPGTYRAISEIHGVSKTTVGEIKTGKAWRHV